MEALAEKIYRPIEDSDPTRMEIGPSELYWVPVNAITLLPQQRTTYSEEYLEQLKESLISTDEDGRTKIELIHPPTMNIFSSRTRARNYVREMNACWDLEHPVTAIKPYENGFGTAYPALIAGHRRIMAIRMILEEMKVDPDSVDVLMSVHQDMRFTDALDLQYKENEHQRLSPWQDARAIATRYKTGLERGEFSSYVECARKMGVKPEKVSSAWKFMQLPQEIQEKVQNASDSRLSYTKSVFLYPYAHAVAVSMLTGKAAQVDQITDEEYIEARSSLEKLSLEELVSDHDEQEKGHYEFQIRNMSNTISRSPKAKAAQIIKENVSDVKSQSSISDFMLIADYDPIKRMQRINEIKKNRTATYHLGSTVLNALMSDRIELKKLNDESSDNESLLKVILTPHARRVWRRVAEGLLQDDGVIPNDAYIEAWKRETAEITQELERLLGGLVLPSSWEFAEELLKPQEVREEGLFAHVT